MSYDGDDGLAVALEERLNEAAPALTSNPGLVPGARRRYRRQRLASMAAGAGALAGLAGGGVAAVQWLSPGQAVVTTAADGAGGDPAGAGASGGDASAPVGDGTATVLDVGGIPFLLPAGFEPTAPVAITDLTPSAQDPTLPGGVSLVAQAEPAGGQAEGQLSIALYEGPVAEDAAGRDDQASFGTTPVEHLTIAGHDARVAVVAECGDGCLIAKPIERGGALPGRDQVVLGPTPFPHVDLHVLLGPDAYLVVNTAGISRDDVVVMAAAAIEANGRAVPTD